MVRPIFAIVILGLAARLSLAQPTPEEQKLADEAKALTREGFQLYQRGQPAEAVAKVRRALEIRQKLYPESKYPEGHPALAASISNLGFIHQATGSFEK